MEEAVRKQPALSASLTPRIGTPNKDRYYFQTKIDHIVKEA